MPNLYGHMHIQCFNDKSACKYVAIAYLQLRRLIYTLLFTAAYINYLLLESLVFTSDRIDLIFFSLLFRIPLIPTHL